MRHIESLRQHLDQAMSIGVHQHQALFCHIRPSAVHHTLTKNIVLIFNVGTELIMEACVEDELLTTESPHETLRPKSPARYSNA